MSNAGHGRNQHGEAAALTAMKAARDIPDEHVQPVPAPGDSQLASYTVRSQQPGSISQYIISNVFTTWATCSCPVGCDGLLCKHHAKVLQMLG